MIEEEKLELARENDPWKDLLILLLFGLAGFFVAQFLAYIIVLPLFDFKAYELAKVMSSSEFGSENRNAFLLMQAVSSTTLFLITPLAYIYLYERKKLKNYGFKKTSNNDIRILGLTLILVVCYMPLSRYLVYLNETITFPEPLKDLEILLRSTEDQLRKLTEFLIDFESTGQFLIGIVIIALIPGIGEELFFRGLIQNKLLKSIKNVHISIWLCAFLFSAFHLQFYGLIPRMFLGALFGYLYYWTKNIAVPIFAHFVNNAFTLLMVYIYSLGITDVDLESKPDFMIEFAIISILIVVILLYIIRKEVKTSILKHNT